MMRILPKFILLVFLLPTTIAAHDHPPTAVTYIENLGQWEHPFLFRAAVNGAVAFLEKDGVTWVKLQEDADEIMHDMSEMPSDQRERIQLSGHAWRMNFHGASADPEIKGSDPASYTHNYFLGNDTTQWRSGVRSMHIVTYKDVWPGIDVVFQGTENGNLKYDMVIHPGADPSVVGFTFEGTDGVSITDDGQLVLSTTVGEVRELAPVAYYKDDESPISCAFELINGVLRFRSHDHDRSRALVIDPELIASTYSGAVSYSNYGHCATYDDNGNIYTGARSFGPGYPTELGSFQSTFGGGSVDISVSKLSPDGSALIWASYLGGSASEYPHSLIVDHQEQLCVLGSTTSNNFPVTANAVQQVYGGSTDMVVSVFSTDGSALIGSTYLGGTDSDGNNNMYANYGEAYRGEIMVDDNNDILVASFSNSADFPVSGNAYQSTIGGQQDGVVLSLNTTCNDLLWSTFIGGAANDGAFGLRVVEGEVYISGQTHSTDMPTTAGAYQTTNQGGQDGFVVRLNANGSQLLAGTYFGSNSADRPYFLDTDTDGNIWIYGQTTGPIPVQPAGIYGDAGGTIFLAKLDPQLSNVLLSTKIGPGSSPVMTPVAFLVDRCDKIYVSGYNASWSGLPVTADALATSGSFYLAAFDVDMADLAFATFYGGNHVDGGTSRFDKNGIVYQGVCATGNSMQTTAWAHGTAQNIAWDIGVFKIDFQVAGVTAAGASPINQGCAPIDIQFSNSSTGTDWLWDFGDGSAPVTAFEPSHLYTDAGNYTITLIASDSMACNLADTIAFEIEIGQGEPAVASFIADQDPACSITEVSFTNTSTGGLLEFFWDMGDGTQYTDTNVTHTYADPGSYDVQLTIVDPSGCGQPDSTMQTIQVVLDIVLVEAIADVVPPGLCEMTVVTTNNSTGVAPTYEWQMGDGSVHTDASVSHTYAEPGEYTILFIASDPATCNVSDTLSWDIVIEAATEVALAFEADLQQDCSAGLVQTTNLSNADGLEYFWDMGDGNEYTGVDVTHLYTEPGFYMITLSATDASGCADPMPFYETVYVAEPLPVTAGFSAEFEHGCDGSQLTATNFSGGDSLAYEWSFGDGNTSTDVNAEHLYTQQGELILQLVVIDLNGCMPNDTMQQAINIPGETLADPSFDHTLMDNCNGAQFIGQANSDSQTGYTWNMGDGTVLSGTYVDHQYPQAGNYEVTLLVDGPNGCGIDSSSVNVQVELPVPMELSFDLSEVEECGSSSVTCSNTSIGNGLNYIWWTSDGYSYYTPDMQHTFTEPGEYEIRFYGMDPMGCFGPDSVVVAIVVEPILPVTAEFTVTTDQDCDGTIVSGSTGNLSEELTYAWSMGDGTSYSDPQVVHQYQDAGTYSMQLTVTDNTGCHEPQSFTEQIVVTEPPIITAGLQIETTQNCGTMDVILQSTSTGSPAEMIWDMGDGNLLYGEAVAYTYDEPGDHTITLTVNDPESCNLTDSESITITVDTLPVFVASFELEQTGECQEIQVNCANTSTGEGVVHAWSMGDGTTFDSFNASHLYNVPGTYIIQLIVSDPSGCPAADTAFAEIVVPEPVPLTPEMTVMQTGDCGLMHVECSNLVENTMFEWLWDMGDGTQYDTFDASHSYTEPGTYNVSLIVSDPACGQQAIAVVPVVVTNGVPVVQLSSPVICPGTSVTLDASASPGIYTWNNGSNASNITVTVPGTYWVSVEDPDGCIGTANVIVPAGQEFELEETIQSCPEEIVPLTIPIEGIAYGWSNGGIDRTEHVRGAGTYEFVVTDNDGCQHTGTYIVEALDAEAQLYAPNAFTPDGDGINDEFTIYGHGDASSKLTIFNRWGEMLYETSANPPMWDGFFNGSIVKQDVYVYQLEYRSECSNAMVNTTGHVSVIK